MTWETDNVDTWEAVDRVWPRGYVRVRRCAWRGCRRILTNPKHCLCDKHEDMAWHMDEMSREHREDTARPHDVQ